MAQLIKIQDYISRYQRDIFHYPGQFIRLKNENWKKLLYTWQMEQETKNQLYVDDVEESNFSKWKSFFKKREKIDEEYNEDDKTDIPKTETALKQYFLDNLISFQLNWASTTVSEMSFLDRELRTDFTLKYFLQRFPDTFLLFYKPIFDLKKISLETDLILISPLGIEIIQILEVDSSTSIIVGDERTWYLEENNIQSRILSPIISLKRTEQVIKSILNKYELKFPIKKTVLSRTNVIDYNSEPFNTQYIDSKRHEKWLTEKRSLVSPLKHRQLKVCECLLKHCYTSAVRRPEWNEENDISPF
ncbi:NERD domain-containing protein [Aquibacillus saliphilus]|uniref:NERD domain-containing protein n=1 Tax=Aquibacillus saliphilus TaxID=1909422 RepID=UPI001CEFEC44|nr:NERD domain-containing protein [Aquibacillus saliphilus]